jgi:DNA polymerase-3 subunit delta'
MPFAELVDQDHAVLLLRTAARTGRVAHAYLFAGPAGVGRRSAAQAFAQLLNCHRPDADACGRCPACEAIAAGRHPDVRVVDVARGVLLDPDDTTRTGIGIRQVLALRREVVYPPYQGRWKVYILADAETLTLEAANSLLKVLEEPPPQVVIILIAESTVPLPATVVSRCQLVRFTLLPPALVERALLQRGVGPEEARYAAALSGGQLSRALQWATSEEVRQRRGRVLELLEGLEHADPLQILDAAEALAREKEILADLLEIALFWYRDLLVWQQTHSDQQLVNLDRRERIAALAASTPAADLASRLDAVRDAQDALRRNVHPRLLLETLFLRLARPAEGARRGT